MLAACRENGFEPAKRLFTMDDQTAISLVGVGVAVAPSSVGADPRSGVRFHKIASPNVGTSLSLCHRLDERAPQIRNFVEIAQKVARKSPRARPE